MVGSYCMYGRKPGGMSNIVEDIFAISGFDLE